MKKDLIDLSKKTKCFKEIYEAYKNSLKVKKFKLDLYSALCKYRQEKMNSLTNEDIIKEEIGNQVKQYRNTFGYSTKLSSKNRFNLNDKKLEERNNVLTVFNILNKKGQFDPPGFKPKVNTNSNFSNIIITNNKYKTRRISSNEFLPIISSKHFNLKKFSIYKKKQTQISIENYAHIIEEDSKKIKIGVNNSVNKLNDDYNKFNRQLIFNSHGISKIFEKNKHTTDLG